MAQQLGKCASNFSGRLTGSLVQAEGIELVGEAADGNAALHLISSLQPDVVLMDLRMPVMDGLEAIGRIRARWPQIAIIVLTIYNEDDLMLRSLQAGVRGYLLKESSLETVLPSDRTRAGGAGQDRGGRMQ